MLDNRDSIQISILNKNLEELNRHNKRNNNNNGDDSNAFAIVVLLLFLIGACAMFKPFSGLKEAINFFKILL